MSATDLILAHLPLQRGTSVRALRLATGLPERAVRDALAALVVHELQPVVAFPEPNGVWFTDDPADCLAAAAQLEERAAALHVRAAALRQVAEVLARKRGKGHQLSLFAA